ncbi:MAG: Gfo/Idh/MocA family protein [Flavisolibacter sp.]
MIQWGIIGCGDVTEIKSGPAFKKVPNSKLVAVMRRQAEKAKDYAARHQVPKWYHDASQLINDPEVNAIYIATPPVYHEEYAIAAVAAGKPFYLEKPMAMNAASAKKITTAANEKNVRLSIAHYRRQQEKFLFIRNFIIQKKFGKIKKVTLIFSQPPNPSMIARTEQPWRFDPAISGGGLFHDLAPHQLDLMLYFFGKPLHASGKSFNLHGNYEADDTATAEIIFENNISFNGSWAFESKEKSDICTIEGSEGKISFSIFNDQQVQVTVNNKAEIFEFPHLPHVQQPMIEKVVEYFTGYGPNPCPGEDGVIVMQMIDAVVKKGNLN